MGQERETDSEGECEMGKEGLFCRRRLVNALKGGVVGFVLGFLIFAAMQLLGLFIFGNVLSYLNSLYVSLYMGIGIGLVSLFGVLLLLPRQTFKVDIRGVATSSIGDHSMDTYLGENIPKEGLSENQEKIAEEKPEEDALRRLKESHEPTDTRKDK